MVRVQCITVYSLHNYLFIVVHHHCLFLFHGLTKAPMVAVVRLNGFSCLVLCMQCVHADFNSDVKIICIKSRR